MKAIHKCLLAGCAEDIQRSQEFCSREHELLFWLRFTNTAVAMGLREPAPTEEEKTWLREVDNE